MFALICCALMMGTRPAGAAANPDGHAAEGPLVLEHSVPAPSQWVPEAPPRLVLTFSQEVALEGSSVHLSSYRNPEVPGELRQTGPRELVFIPGVPLAEATYEVIWSVRTPAGERAQGRFGFTYLSPQDDWDEPLDRRDINRLLGNLAPGWLLIIPAAAGVGGLIWILWNVWRD